MSICYLCGNELTNENESVEHIIPNSIGGRLKSSKLLCIKRNNEFGTDIDSELSKQFQFFAIYLMIDRERGKSPAFIFDKLDNDDNYMLESNGAVKLKHINFKEQRDGNIIKYAIRANTSDEINTIVDTLKKKNKGEINITSRGTDNKAVEIDNVLCFDPKVFPAILKIAISMYIKVTDDIGSVKEAINDLKTDNGDRVDHIILNNDIIEPIDNEVSHFIYIRGSKKEKKLYAIVELFNTKQYIVKLSVDYNKEDIEYIYIYDLMSKTEVSHPILNAPSFDYIFDYNYTKAELDFSIVQKKMSRVMSIGFEQHNSKEIEKTMKEVYQEYYDSQNNEMQLFLKLNEVSVKNEIRALYIKNINTNSSNSKDIL